MQNSRISEQHYPSTLQSAQILLSLLGLVLSGTLLAQTADNTDAAAAPSITLSKPAEDDHPAAAESKASSSKPSVDDTNQIFQATMKQSIEAARQSKMRELAEAERAKLGIKAEIPAAAVAPVVNKLAIESVVKVAAAPVSTPRLWSLTAAGARVWAEVWLDGKIIQLDSMDGQIIQLDADERLPQLGEWTPLTLTADGLLLGRKSSASTAKSKASKAKPVVVAQERLLLRPPAKGLSVVTYKFASPMSAAGATEALSDAAQRATQLPQEQMGSFR